MRVLLTVPSLEPAFGGPSVKVTPLARALGSLGHEVAVAGVGHAAGTIGLPEALRFHGTPVPARLGAMLRLVTGADVVHVIGFRDPVGTAAALAARRRGIPYVLEPVGMHRRRLRSVALKRAYDLALGDRMVRGAALVVATSGLERNELVADGVPAECIHLRPNGVDVDGLLPLPPRGMFRAQHGVPGGAPLVLALGRISRKKGLVDLVRSVQGVPSAWCAVVGPDDGDGALDDLRGAIAELGISDRVVVHARATWGSDKARAFADADVFCLPSAAENFGIAAAEAACLGVPVVVSDRCGVAEWLGPSGAEVVPFGDISALTGAIARLSGESARVRAGAGATELRRQLSWSRQAERQAALYRMAVGR